MLLNCLMAAALLSLAAALYRQRATKRLRLYIASEIVATAGIEVAALAWPDFNSREYTAAYCVARCVDLAAALWLSRPRAGTIGAGLCFAAIASLGISSLDFNSAISLVQGGCFAIAALSIRLLPFSVVNIALGVLWASLALFYFAYAMYWRSEAMWNLSFYWNTLIFTAAFVLIAMVKQHASHATT